MRGGMFVSVDVRACQFSDCFLSPILHFVNKSEYVYIYICEDSYTYVCFEKYTCVYNNMYIYSLSYTSLHPLSPLCFLFLYAFLP